MISPHLLQVHTSYSTRSLVCASESGSRYRAIEMWGTETPILILPNKNKNPTWCHMIFADGPGLGQDAKKSNLIIIWWSEMSPDTDRVLSAIDWEKYAKDVSK